jgi:UDP-N-acetylglucosamine--N-acetylmuramyl-(pentapeptide) pyrophosphoryl-undecaprenol N-acetylglucosamine transferase
MKIVFTGGGTGGHFYPIIAVAESVRKIVDEEKIVNLELYYYSDSPYDKEALFENGIQYHHVTAGKRRMYRSIQNFFDLFKMGIGVLQATGSLFSLYPDVVFGKGGYASFPVLMAARLLGIPVVIHDSDSVPGRVNKWAGSFAKKVAISFDEAAEYFPKKKVALTGQPIRKDLLEKKSEGAFEYLKLDPTTPTILVLGGSLGAEAINDVVVDSLPELLEKYQVIHQTGVKNFDAVKSRSDFMLADSDEKKARYRPYPFLNPLALKMSAGAASLVISRAGSMVFEIASWGVPAILIPIDESHGDHQKKNAFNYARHGAAEVIEQGNLSHTILLSEINRFYEDDIRRRNMMASAKAFATPEAADKIAKMLISIAIEHEK